MCMIQSSALDVLLARALETSALGTSGQAKDRLIVEVLHGPAKPESKAVVIFAVEVEFRVERRGIFQEARILLIIVAEAWVDPSGVREEGQNFQRQRAEAARGDDIIRKRCPTCRRHGNRLSVGIESQGRVRGVGSLIRIINKLRDGPEISATEVIPGHGQNVKL